MAPATGATILATTTTTTTTAAAAAAAAAVMELGAAAPMPMEPMGKRLPLRLPLPQPLKKRKEQLREPQPPASWGPWATVPSPNHSPASSAALFSLPAVHMDTPFFMLPEPVQDQRSAEQQAADLVARIRGKQRAVVRLRQQLAVVLQKREWSGLLRPATASAVAMDITPCPFCGLRDDTDYQTGQPVCHCGEAGCFSVLSRLLSRLEEKDRRREAACA